MKVDAAKSIIAEWLEERSLPDLIERDAVPIDFSKLTDIIAIVGPRRAGKTYYMYQLIQYLLNSGVLKEEIIFIDFEDYRLINVSASDIDELFSAFRQLTGRQPTYLFFDEIQQFPHWNRVLRTLHNKGRYKIIISGSNSKLLSREIATELRGRYRDRIMLPLSFSELLRFKRFEYNEKMIYTHARGELLELFDCYLKEGGFPEVIQRDTNREKKELLQSYYRTLFYRDIIERYNIKSKSILEIMMSYCIEAYAELFSISGFAKYLHNYDLAVSKKTISNYLNYLRDAFFIILNDKFSFSPRKRLMNPKKVYLLDTGFGFLGTPFSENRGKLLENVVAIELLRRQQEIFYFKNHGECDFIIKQGLKPAEAIQVTWELTATSRQRELKGLTEAMRSLNLTQGKILTYNQEEQIAIEGGKIQIAPVWKWLLGAQLN